MGVPKFFRWLYERYPCLCEVVREYQIPEFDNLYLDMNGIIHICSHPNDNDPQFRISEENIFKDIFHYIEIVFRMIQPQKLFFMAVDGVAPRAKMNQQRGRRFRKAKEGVDMDKKAVDAGVALPDEERFDSNCITPGTEFMEKLQHQLRYFIADKMSHDKLWKNVKVILSGHETPGEGEHKIMDYIRYMKAQPDFDHNTKHCLYGLDADLLMLGLCTHEPHFSLLREEVNFGRKAKRSTTPEGTKFYLLHLSLMRDYLDLEFGILKDKLPFGYDIEKIIDDWVLMGFLVGNDFIPHLPGLHIANGALPILHKIYMEIMPTMDGYINEGGTLVLSRFQRYMEKLSSFDIHQFKDEYTDLKYFEGKSSRKMGVNKERPKFFETEPDDVLCEPLEPCSSSVRDPKLQGLINFTEEMENLSVLDNHEDEDLEQLFGGIEDDFQTEEEDDDDDDDEPNADMYHEFYQKKRDYYTNKLDFEKVTPEVLRSQAEGYVRAIQWNLHYYYNGVCSWSWFYPHHYAPYISDIKNFCDLEIKFEMGKPFLPYEQLLAVLPSLSKNLLPEAFHILMEDEKSPIIDYYPTTFQTDLNGKRQEWEAVVLIPFIDEERLLKAMEPLMEQLSDEEKRRNKHGPMLVYTYSGKSVGTFEAEYFPKILSNHALEKRVMREEIFVPIEKLTKGLCSGVELEVHYPGFPTLKHVPHHATLQKGKVKVFESPSREESMILHVQTDELVQWKKGTAEIAAELLGNSFQVSWPHLYEAKIIEVLDSKQKYSLEVVDNSKEKLNGGNKNPSKKLTFKVEDCKQEWALVLRSVQEHYSTFLGIQLGPVSTIVRALPFAGYKYSFFASGKVNLEKQWARIPVSFAIQTVVKDVQVKERAFVECKTIHELFPPKTVVFLLGYPHYGCMGQVTEIIPAAPGKVARVKISVQVLPEPDMETVKALLMNKGMKYYPGGVAAQRIGINSHLLSRITGTIYVAPSGNELFSKSVNIGLGLKFNKRNEEVPGFTKKDNNIWLYSDQCIELLHSYIAKFPELFQYLNEHSNTNDDFQESNIFPQNSKSEVKMKDVVNWLAEQPHNKVEHRKCGAEVLDKEVVIEIEKEVIRKDAANTTAKTVSISVQPHLIYKPGFKIGHLLPDKKTEYMLYDRVVNVRECYTVPLGLRGTVIGIQRAEKVEDTLYDIVFDSEFPGGGQILGCSPGKGYRLPAYALVNLTHGERINKYGSDVVSAARNAAKAHSQSSVSILPSGNILIRHQNRQGDHPSIGVSRPQPGVPDRPASAFASWRGGCSGFLQGPSSNLPGKEGFSNHRGPPKNDSTTNPTVILKRPAPEPSSNQMDKHQPPDISNEYQDKWLELQKASARASSVKNEELPKSASYPFMMNLNQKPSAEITESEEVKESETYMLKKLLRIDSTTPSTAVSLSPQVPQPVTFPSKKPISSPPEEASPLSVQDFFEKAKAVSAKQQEQPQKQPVNHCVQIISLFQRSGMGIPRYDYLTLENGLIVATITLPSQHTFRGEPTSTREKASESVAKIAFTQMSSWSKQDLKFGGIQMPANKLPAPPPQWYQQQMQQQQHGTFPHYQNQTPWQNNMYQKLNWREPQDQSTEWRRRHNPSQWQGNRPPLTPPGPMFQQRFIPPQYHYPPYPAYPNQPQHPPWNNNQQPIWRQPPPIHTQMKPQNEVVFPQGANGPSSMSPFVPLQAVRAQMSANSQQVLSPKHQKHLPKTQTYGEAKLESNVRTSTPIGTSTSKSTSTPKSASTQVLLPEGSKMIRDLPNKEGDSKSKVEPSVRQTVLQPCVNQDNDKKGLSKIKEEESKSRNKDNVKKGKEMYVPPHMRKSRLAIKFGVDP